MTSTLQAATVPGTPITISIIALRSGLFNCSMVVEGGETWHGVCDYEYTMDNEEDIRKYARAMWRNIVEIRNEAEAPAPRPEVSEGFWECEGSIFKLVKSMSSGNLYAKRRTEDGGFEYAPGAIRMIRDHGTPLTRETAAKYGKLYGMCCKCGRTLTDEASIEAGIGPVCAGKLGF